MSDKPKLTASTKRCKECKKQRDDCTFCDDCSLPVCADCRINHPHHDPPETLCETCYWSGDDDDDDDFEDEFDDGL